MFSFPTLNPLPKGQKVARRTVGGQRATLCALSQQVLRPVLLRMDRYALGHGTATARSLGGRPVSWNVPNRARPIVMDSSRRAVLGVTAEDGQIAMPLDAELGLIVSRVARFLGSTSHAILFWSASRRAMQAYRGPVSTAAIWRTCPSVSRESAATSGQRRPVREAREFKGHPAGGHPHTPPENRGTGAGTGGGTSGRQNAATWPE